MNGRLKDLIIVRGRNYYPADIEMALELAHPSIAPNAAAAFPIERVTHGVAEAGVAEAGVAEETFAVICEIRRELRRNLQTPAVADAVFDAIERSIVAAVGIGPRAIALLKPGAIPRTTSGKIRRHACRELFEAGALEPVAAREDATRQGALPRSSLVGTDLSARIRAAIASLRNVDPAWLDDLTPLAELGVDSLLETELLLTLEAECGVRLPAGAFDTAMSISELAAAIEARRAAVPHAQAAPADGTGVPLTPQQRRFLQSGVEHPNRLTTVVMLRTPPQAEKVIRAIEAAEREFDALRLRFHEVDGVWRQTYAPAGGAIAVERIPLIGATAAEVAAQRDRIEKELHATLDIGTGPLARAMLFDRGPHEPGLLALSVHHLVADGLSVVVLASAIDGNLDRNFDNDPSPNGAAPRLAEPAFGDWARALDELAQSPEVTSEIEMWERICGPETTPAALPAGEGTILPARFLNPAEQRRFEERAPFAREQRDVLLAALWGAWRAATGETEMLVWMENNGRGVIPALKPERTMGWFTCEYPVRLKPVSGDPLRDVRTALEALPREGAGYGMLRYIHRDPAVRARMDALATPPVRFRFPRLLHRAGRGRALRLLRNYSTFGGRGLSRYPPIDFLVQQKSGVAAWQIQYNEDAPRGVPEALLHGVAGQLGVQDRVQAQIWAESHPITGG